VTSAGQCTDTLDIIHQQWVETLDAIRDPIFVLDSNGCVIRANVSFAQLAGSSFPELLNRPIDDLLPWLVPGLHAPEKALRTAPNGRVFRIKSSRLDNRRAGTVFILEDVTDLHALELAESRHAEATQNNLAEMLKTLSTVLDKKDPYTVEHNRNVAEVAFLIANRMGYSEDQAKGIYLGSLAHDIGKLCIPSSILNRPGKLDDAEISLIRLHPRNGFNFVENLEFPWPVHEIALQHHERLDGSGYPYGLKGEQISAAARIATVADVADAMSSNRPYRYAPGMESAVSELGSGRGKIYDTDVVDAFLAVVATDHDRLPPTWKT
jgi:HD-GYP domain-containing protein (c-di-GMP phosphodiesterase class II)